MAVGSITSTLGAGSGLNIKELVDGLVDAQFATKQKMLETRQESLKAQISSTSELKSAVTGFSTALATLSRGGTLSTQPTSSNPAIVKTTLLTGASAANLSASVEVLQIAQGQTTNSALIADAAAPIGTGKLTLTFGAATTENGAMTGFTAGGGTPVEIDITSANNSLTGIAAAINAQKVGITASVLSDINGSRLVLKGQTGESQAFTLTATEDAGAPGLSQLNVGPGASGTTIAAPAQDARVVVDGVRVQRASNSINNLLPGVRLDLTSAAPGTVVQIGAQLPTEALSQAVKDFVDTYNGLQAMLTKATDPVTGELRADPAARALKTSLRQLAATRIISDEGPQTLAEVGVATNRDGTLRIDTAVLSRALSGNPASVEAMFKPGAGLPAAFSTIASAAADTNSGLGASEARLTKQQKELGEQSEKALAAIETTRTRMTQQFASMDSRVAAYKATESFIKQQVAVWTKAD